MAAGAVIAHAGHPAEWLPFVAPLLLFAVAWFVIRAREAGAAAAERDDEDAERRSAHDASPPDA